MGRIDEAEACCRDAIRIQPDAAEAHFNLAFLLSESGRYTEAGVSYQEALRYKPDFVAALYSMGCLLAKIGRLDEAEACCRRAIQVDPDCADAHGDLGFILVEQGRIAEAQSVYREAMRLLPESPGLRSSYLFCLNYDPRLDPGTLLAEHRRFGALLEGQAADRRLRGPRPVRGTPPPGRLRLA